MNTRSTVNGKAYQEAVRNIGCPIEHPTITEERTSKCSTDTQQSDSQLSNAPDEVREERHTIYVVDKANKVKTVPCSPESPTVPLSLPIPHLTSNEPILMLTAIWQDLDVVISEDKETSANKHLPEAEVAPTLPIHSPALPMQAAALYQLLGEALSHIEVALGWGNLHIINTELLSSNECSLTWEAARKQSKVIKAASVEGKGRYLEWATAYVREHMGRCTLCNAFIPWAPKEPPDKLAENEPRRCGQEVVSKSTTSAV